MARPRGYDRETVLAAARDLFWERGYDATSITDLEQCTGLNRSSLYQEFGSKDGLFEAALACYADQVVARLFDPVRSPGAAPRRSLGSSCAWAGCCGATRRRTGAAACW